MFLELGFPNLRGPGTKASRGGAFPMHQGAPLGLRDTPRRELGRGRGVRCECSQHRPEGLLPAESWPRAPLRTALTASPASWDPHYPLGPRRSGSRWPCQRSQVPSPNDSPQRIP